MAAPNGTGNSTSNRVNATRSSSFASHAATSEGESAGVGSTYSAELVERENRSMHAANLGPDRAGSAIGNSRLPIATSARRKTNVIG